MRRFRHLPFFLVGLLLVCLASCRDLLLYAHYESVDAEGWLPGDTCRIDIPEMDTDTVLTVSISANVSQKYPLQTLPLSVILRCEGRDSIREEMELSVFNEPTNERKSSPLSVTTTKRIREMSFKKGLHYDVRIVQRAMNDGVEGVREVGLLLF